MRKKILSTMIVVWIIVLTTDYVLYKFNKRLIFSIPFKVYKDGGTTEYYGIGYKIIKYNVFDNKVTGELGKKDMEFGLWTLKYSKE